MTLEISRESPTRLSRERHILANMAIQLSVSVRTARQATLESTIGTSPKLLIFSGTVPADCAAADPAGLLATLPLPSDWLTQAAGVSTQAGSWTVAASGNGTAASFRIKDTAGTTCHLQGTVTATGGGGDMTLDNTVIATSQVITIGSVTPASFTDANA